MPPSSRRLLDPQDHGSLEDITLHPQLHDIATELVKLASLIARESLSVTPRDLVLVHPVPKRPRIQIKITGDLSDRLARLPNNPNRALSKLRVVLPTYLCHDIPS